MKLRSSVFGWKSVWMELADEAKGEFIDGPHVVTVRVPVPDKPWTITFKMHEHGIGKGAKQQTIVSVPYKAARDFGFAIRNKNWIEEAAKAFGLQDIVVGDEEFDPEYIIQGNDEKLVRSLFSSQPLKDQIVAQKAVRINVNKDASQLAPFGNVPAGVHVLAFTEEGAINSFDRLTSIYKLLVATLDEMCRIGATSHTDPRCEI